MGSVFQPNTGLDPAIWAPFCIPNINHRRGEIIWRGPMALFLICVNGCRYKLSSAYMSVSGLSASGGKAISGGKTPEALGPKGVLPGQIILQLPKLPKIQTVIMDIKSV